MQTYQNIILRRVRDIPSDDLIDSVTFGATVCGDKIQVELYNSTYRVLGNPSSIIISNDDYVLQRS